MDRLEMQVNQVRLLWPQYLQAICRWVGMQEIFVM